MDTNNINNASASCPVCGKAVKPTAKFCVGCGTKLDLSTPAPDSNIPEPAAPVFAAEPVNETPSPFASYEETKPADSAFAAAHEEPVASPFAAYDETKPADSAFATYDETQPEATVSSPFGSFGDVQTEESAPSPFGTFGESQPAATAFAEESAPSFGGEMAESSPSAFASMSEDIPVSAPAFTSADAPSPFAPADISVTPPSDTVAAFSSAESTADIRISEPESAYTEPESVFAQGLPEWSVEPPLTAVRRRRK